METDMNKLHLKVTVEGTNWDVTNHVILFFMTDIERQAYKQGADQIARLAGNIIIEEVKDEIPM